LVRTHLVSAVQVKLFLQELAGHHLDVQHMSLHICCTLLLLLLLLLLL
jgi:hypothetical protein